MEVTVNQQKFTISTDCSVAQLLAITLDRPAAGIAVAVNQTIVPKANWDAYFLNSGDHVVLITATQGG